MKVVRIAMFGHRDFSSHIFFEEKFKQIIFPILSQGFFVEFFVGRSGEFDIFAALCIKRIKSLYGSDMCEMTLILPYKNRNIEYYENYYDTVFIPDSCNKSHPKAAITKRNRWMVDFCDTVICFIEHDFGGAYSAMKYAERSGKRVINLFCSDNMRNITC